ncbi:craniofacial development protein 2-like [Topomyia yanbarensis]|uniref:craniofacial development protein 2-like n=1 Tax=Topomyia yanbarensis TaxID=2498891 RepID=UPI00273C3BD9|nr:craniofacial development protein 2-like [Topomyia yanbarensis]
MVRIGTWNVLTLAQQGKLAQLANEACRMKLEILGLSEVRWPNFGEHRLLSGQLLLYSGLRGEHAPRHRGVGFLLSAHAYPVLMKWEPINERIIVARFRTRVRNLTMIQCYAPTDAAEMQEKENFYSDIKIYMGDFNAKVGSDNSDYGLGEMSENGELLAEFCGNNDMVDRGIVLPPFGQYTKSLLDVRNKRSADIASDHYLQIGEIRLRIARIHRQEEKIGRRFNTRRLEDAAVRRSFVEELKNHAAEIPEGGSVEDQWTAIKNAFIATGETNLGELRTQSKQ